MIDRFSTVLSDIERDLGTKDLNRLVLHSLRDSIRACKINSLESLKSQMKDLIHTFNNTQPRYAIIIYSLYHIYHEICLISDGPQSKQSYAANRPKIIAAINKQVMQQVRNKKNILKFSEKINIDNKTILIHDHSHTVQEVLKHFKKKRKKFRVLVAEQDMEKTLSNIEMLTRNGIPFQVVPAHMLSNIEDEVDMCFFGALTLKSTYDFVVDTGTNAIISEFHLHKTPIYFFVSTNKFALWKAKKKGSARKDIHMRKHPFKKLEFERLKFSHDRVPLSSVNFTVTEQGIFNEKDLKNVYGEKFKAQVEIMKEINRI